MPGMIGSSADVARYDPSKATGSDKLMMLGAMLRDVGGGLNGSGGDAILQTQGLLAQRQMLAQRNALLQQVLGAPGAPATAAGGGTPGPSGGSAQQGGVAPGGQPGGLTDDRLALIGPQFGLDVKEYLNAKKLLQPHMIQGTDGKWYNDKDGSLAGQTSPNRANVGGTIVDMNDASNTNRNVPAPPVPGAMPVYDNRGQVVDWTLPKGTQNAMRLQQLPGIMRGEAALQDAATGVGRLRTDQSKNAYAPPPGFRIRKPKGS